MANVVRHSEQRHDILCEAEWCTGGAFGNFTDTAEILRSGFHCRVSFHDDPAIILDDGQGLGAGFSSVYSHFASSAISPTASAAGSVVDGNYSYGNMQTENVNGFSWSTNSTTSFGQMMYQTGSGATATQTRDGNMVMDASGAMSRLPVGINATRQIAAAQQEMAREASNRAESALHGFSSSIASAWNTLSQFGSNRGSSDSVTGGADSTMSAQDSMMASRMRSAVESYAKAHNISNEQATQELASTSTRLSGGMYADAHAEWGLNLKFLVLVVG